MKVTDWIGAYGEPQRVKFDAECNRYFLLIYRYYSLFSR